MSHLTYFKVKIKKNKDIYGSYPWFSVKQEEICPLGKQNLEAWGHPWSNLDQVFEKLSYGSSNNALITVTRKG